MENRFFFRVWDTRKGQYVPKEYVYHAEIGLLVRATMFIVEQCTGLKDKNDKLIYEGDIVYIEDYGYARIKWDKDFAKFVVVKSNEEYYMFDEIFPEDMEVIGNIYENPELLKECE